MAADLFAQAEACQGCLNVPFERFCAKIEAAAARRLGSVASAQDVEHFLANLHASDVYLTTACACGEDQAWRRFLELHGRFIAGSIRCISRDPAISDELIATTPSHLFLPDATGASRIGSYSGWSPVRCWLRTVIANRVLNERERRRYEPLKAELAAELLAAKALNQALDSSRHSVRVARSLSRAFAELSERERDIILLRYLCELPLDEIAHSYGVHVSTASRVVDRTLKRLRQSMLPAVSEEIGIVNWELPGPLELISELGVEARRRHAAAKKNLGSAANGGQ